MAQTVVGSIQIAWDANLTDPDLAGYRCYAHTDPNTFTLPPATARGIARTIDVGTNVTNALFSSLDASKTWYFAVTSLDTSGNESVFSTVVGAQPAGAPIVRTITPPSAPEGATGVVVTVNGQYFLPTSTISFGAGITVNSLDASGAPTTLLADITVAPLAQVSNRDVIVTNSAGAAGTRPAGFAVTFNPVRADIDRSGTVDAADFVYLLLGFPSFVGDAHYSTNRDLDVDGKVDGADFAIFFSVF